MSTNGSDWTVLGDGLRIAGDWQRRDVTLPAEGSLRARGYVSGGMYNASGWFVEAYYGRPVFVAQPVSRTNDVGTTATLSAVAGGIEPFSFQWLKEGVPLVDVANIAGAATAVLTLTNVLSSDAGGYCVAVSNDFGAVTSQVAVLTVRTLPEIVAQPQDQAVKAGASATFQVAALGPSPLLYQWSFWGTNLNLEPWRWRPGETPTNATLTVTNVRADQLGPYRVEVSNAHGAITSQVATLDMAYPPKIVQFIVQPAMPVVAGENVTFSVEVTNNATLPIGYQLRKSLVLLTNVVFSERTCTFTLHQVSTNSTSTTNGPGTYRVMVTNAANSNPGEFRTVNVTVTNATPPTVVTLAASNVTARGATLRGTVNPNRSTTTAWFEYGLTTGYGSRTLTTNVGNGPDAVQVSLPIVGLLPATNYHYRVVATNWGNYGSLTVGDDIVLTTESALLPAPTIGRCALWGDGGFHFEFSGQAGASYSVLVSTNLVDWEPIGRATEIEPGVFEFTDADVRNHATCFYRLRSP